MAAIIGWILLFIGLFTHSNDFGIKCVIAAALFFIVENLSAIKDELKKRGSIE